MLTSLNSIRYGFLGFIFLASTACNQQEPLAPPVKQPEPERSLAEGWDGGCMVLGKNFIEQHLNWREGNLVMGLGACGHPGQPISPAYLVIARIPAHWTLESHTSLAGPF